MIEEDELIEELTSVFHTLVAEGDLELASRNGASALAVQFANVLEGQPDADLEEWLLEQNEVVELFADADTLREKLRPVMHRLAHGDPPPQWNDELGAAVLAHPDDLQARSILGDWLHQEGDPRGELVAIQLELLGDASKSRSAHLKEQERVLLRRFRSRFLGSLSSLPRAEGAQLTWKCGYLDEAKLNGTHVDDLLALESSRLLRKLEVSLAPASAAEALGRRRVPPTLCELRLGVVDPDRDGPREALAVDHVLAGRLGGVERLDLAGDTVSLGASLARVTHLRIDARKLELARDALRECPELERLELFLVHGVEDNSTTWLELPPPKLHHLRWAVSAYGGFPFSKLLASPLMKQLRVLDLRRSFLHQNDMATLLENAELVAHLERLDLRGLSLGNYEASSSKLSAEVLVGDDPDARSRDEDYDDEYDGEDGEDYDDLPNEDVFLGEEESDESDEEEGGEPRGVDLGAPPEEQLRDQDEDEA